MKPSPFRSMAASSSASDTVVGGRAGGVGEVKKCDRCGYESLNISHFCYISDGKIATLHDQDLREALGLQKKANQTLRSVSFCCFTCAGEVTKGDPWYFQKPGEEGVPTNSFRKLAQRCLKSTSTAFDTRQSVAMVARVEAPEVAETAQLNADILRDRRMREASDWVTQLSSQASAQWDVQLCYGCNCGCIPLKASQLVAAFPSRQAAGSC